MSISIAQLKQIVNSSLVKFELTDDTHVSNLYNVYNIVVDYQMEYSMCPAELLGHLFINFNHMSIQDFRNLPYETVDKIGLSLTNKNSLCFYSLQVKIGSANLDKIANACYKSGFEISCPIGDSWFEKNAPTPLATMLIGAKPNTFLQSVNKLKLYGVDIRDIFIDFVIPVSRDFIRHVGNTIGYRTFFNDILNEIEHHQKYMANHD